jgi:O-antigen ligase
VQVALTVAAALVLGVVGVGSAETVVLLVLALAVVYAVTRSYRWALFGMLLATFTGLNLASAAVGPLSLRPADFFYVALVLWAVARPSRRRPADIGQVPIALLLLVLGVSLIPVAAESFGLFTSPFVSWLRLVQTLSLVWVLPKVLDDESDRQFAANAVMVAAALEVGRALLQAFPGGLSGDRLSGSIGPNAIGLLAAVMLVLALHMPRLSVPSRAVVFGIAVLGLFTAKSVGSLAALGVTLAVVGFGRVGDEHLGRALRPLRVLLLGIGLVAIVGVLRQEALPGSAEFRSGSAQQRLILATAGLEEFQAHPFIGVGWQRSADPSIIGDPQLNADLHEQFGDIRADFFPDTKGGVSSVHNAYVQVLAEAGLVGALALFGVVIACWRRIRALRRKLVGTEALVARAVCSALIVNVLWFNDNAIFGAQPETVLLGTTLGILASFRPDTTNSEDSSQAQGTSTRAVASRKP